MKITGSNGDIESKQQKLEELKSAVEDYKFLFRTSEVPVLIHDEEGIYLDYTDSYAELMGRSNRDDLERVHPSAVSPPKQPNGVSSFEQANLNMEEALRTGSKRFEWLHRLPGGQEFLSDITLEVIQFQGKKCIRATFRDITETRKLEKLVEERTRELQSKKQELEKLSMLDALTQIYNRRKFEDLCIYESARARRNQSPLGILILDIDYFKQYNDTYGHLAGDKCIVKVARIMKRTLSRETDVFARWGGEEFIVLLADTSEAELQHVAQKLINGVTEKRIKHEQSDVAPYLTVSIGGVTGVPDAKDKKCFTLIKEADRLLYEVKGSGRNNYRVSVL